VSNEIVAVDGLDRKSAVSSSNHRRTVELARRVGAIQQRILFVARPPALAIEPVFKSFRGPRALSAVLSAASA
jgi:hypothetical protein